MPPGEECGPEKSTVWLPVYAVAVLPYVSFAVRDALSAEPAVAEPGAETAYVAAAVGATVTPTLPVWVPSLTVTVAVSALYSVMTPLFEPDTVATPLVNVIVSAVPNATAVPVFEVTVGWLEPIVPAPLNVSVWSPP